MIGKAVRFLPEILGVQLRYGLLQPVMRTPLLPRAMHYISTHACNARCVMCGIWKAGSSRNEQLSVSELRSIVRDRLFSRLEYLGISGGEPFLRADLLELVQAFLEGCPRLKRVSVTTNGLPTSRIESVLEPLVQACRASSAFLDISVSVHAVGDLAERIYGVKGAFGKAQETLRLLQGFRREGKLTFSINSVLLADTLAEAPKLLEWAESEAIPVSFVVGEQRERFMNDDLTKAFIPPDRKQELTDFVKAALARNARSAAGLKYRAILDFLEGRPRAVSCYYALSGLLLGYDGTLYYCSHSRAVGNCRDRSAAEIFYDPENLDYRRRELLRATCPQCPPYTTTRLEQEKDIFKLLRFLWFR